MRILLLRLREIGDVVFTTPAIRALRRHYPDAHISYVVEPHAAPVVEGNPHLDEVIVAPRRRGLGGALADLALARRLRAGAYDLAVDFHGGPRAALLTALSGARRRIGYAIPGRRWLYTDTVPRPRELRPRHSVRNQWDLLAPLGIPEPDPCANPVEMASDRAVADAVDRRLRAAGWTPAHRLIVVHVSAGNPFRRWPIEHFVAVVTRLASDPARRIVVTSGPSDRAAATHVIAASRSAVGQQGATRVLDCGELSLVELRALLERAALYIGGDSGPLHIAATTCVPAVGLYGPTLPERSAPWRPASIRSVAIDAGALPCRPCDQRACAPGDFRCLTRIAPERVVEAALAVLTVET